MRQVHSFFLGVVTLALVLVVAATPARRRGQEAEASELLG